MTDRVWMGAGVTATSEEVTVVLNTGETLKFRGGAALRAGAALKVAVLRCAAAEVPPIHPQRGLSLCVVVAEQLVTGVMDVCGVVGRGGGDGT